MDFVVGLPRTPKQNDSVWVIVDRLTKSANFIRVKFNYTTEDYTTIYIYEIVSLYGITLSIISDRGDKFTYRFS